MSTCISHHGEYSEHTPDEDHTCTRCYVLDEDALIADRDRWKACAENAEATIARVEALAASWTWPRSDHGPVTRAHGAQLRRALDGEHCNCLHGQRDLTFGPDSEMGSILATGCPVHGAGGEQR